MFEFMRNGQTYRTDLNADRVEARDGSTWNRTSSAPVLERARNEAYAQRQNHIRVLLAAIEQRVADHAKEIKGPASYNDLGDLAHVQVNLAEVLRFLRGEA